MRPWPTALLRFGSAGERRPGPAPVEVGDDVGRLGLVGRVAVRGLQPEPQVGRVGQRAGTAAAATSPARRARSTWRTAVAHSAGCAQRRRARRAPIQPTGRTAAHAFCCCSSRQVPRGAPGSLGRPSTISPMMLRCTCDVPA